MNRGRRLAACAALVALCALALREAARPDRLLRSLGEQVAELKARSVAYGRRGDQLTSLKLAQLAFLISPDAEQREADRKALTDHLLFEHTSLTFIDHEGAESRVAEELRTLGEPALTQLVLALGAGPPTPGLGCVGLRALKLVSHERFREAVAALLRRGRSDALGWEAAAEVARTEDASFEPDLVALVERWRQWGRQYPIYALRVLKSRAAVPAVLGALEDSSPAVRRHAARYLGELAGGEALAPLQALLAREEDPFARSIAGTALAAIRKRLPPLEHPSAPTGS